MRISKKAKAVAVMCGAANTSLSILLTARCAYLVGIRGGAIIAPRRFATVEEAKAALPPGLSPMPEFVRRRSGRPERFWPARNAPRGVRG